MSTLIKPFTKHYLSEVVSLVHATTRISYRPFYPPEAIDYFIAYHSSENIEHDRQKGYGIVLMDDDTIIESDTLIERLLHTYESENNVGIIGVPNIIPKKAPYLVKYAKYTSAILSIVMFCPP